MNIKLILFLTIASIFHMNFNIDIFNNFPNLKNKISYTKLCDLPTPIEKLSNLSEYLGCKNLFIKRDDLSGSKIGNTRLYGGNKVRKLEFLLADALKKNCKEIITFGCAGSNHALATAVYCKQLGLNCTLMLMDQPNSFFVKQNLLLDDFFESKLIYFENREQRELAAQKRIKKDNTYLIPLGGSNKFGVIGFVNAAFELAHQIKQNRITQPDYIYVATGSCGTVAGLLLGLQAAGIQSKVVAVCVEPESFENEFFCKIKNLFFETNQYLNQLDNTFSIFKFPKDNLIVNKKICGIEYGLSMPETQNAIKLFKVLQNIQLEGTYSAKTLAAIIDDSQKIKDKTVLLWNTYCGFDYSNFIDLNNYKKLPKEFHKYFES